MNGEDLPPYFHIPPDRALKTLGGGAGTRDFAAIAEACRRGREDLAARGLNAAGAKSLRLFSTWEITKYLIPVAAQHYLVREPFRLSIDSASFAEGAVPRSTINQSARSVAAGRT